MEAIKYDTEKVGWFDENGKRRYLGVYATNYLMRKWLERAKRKGDWIQLDFMKTKAQGHYNDFIKKGVK